jgi:hypothetical protein
VATVLWDVFLPGHGRQSTDGLGQI